MSTRATGGSLRFGPPPADLAVVRRLPKAGYGLYVEHVFTPVRARVAGRWMLGYLEEPRSTRDVRSS